MLPDAPMRLKTLVLVGAGKKKESQMMMQKSPRCFGGEISWMKLFGFFVCIVWFISINSLNRIKCSVYYLITDAAYSYSIHCSFCV